MRRTMNILVIEDNPADYKIINIYLNDSSKFNLMHAETLYEAVDISENKSVDFVLLDLSLPDSSGFRTLTTFLDKTQTPFPIIVMTGLNNEIVGTQAIKSGAQDYLIKGQFDQKLLTRAIRYARQRFNEQLQLKKTLNFLEQNQKRYLEAQQISHFGNIEMDIVNLSMDWTDEVYRIFNLSPGSIEPSLTEYLQFCHYEDTAKVEKMFDEVLQHGQKKTLEHRIIVDGHTIKHVALRIGPLLDETTRHIIIFGVIQDITDRKVNEQLTMEKNMSSQNNKIREEILNNIGFHLRTPMASIVNLLYLLESSAGSAQQEFIDGLKTSMYDLSLMVNSMLNYVVTLSNDINIQLDEFSSKEFLESVLKLLKIKVGNSNIESDFGSLLDLPERVKADSKKISLILFNIVDSLLTKAQPNSLLSFNVKFVEGRQNSSFDFQIKINGTGFTQAEKHLIDNGERIISSENKTEDIKFENAQKIGIAKKLTKLMSGSLLITSKENVKTNIQLSIPVEKVEVTKLESSEPTSALSILLVEDHFLNQLAAKKLLQKWSQNVHVDIAENGYIAVEKFHSFKYDLILMDLQMPQMNGFDATIKIREQSKEVPIIALTASSSSHEQERCKEIGMNAYIAKPYNPEQLYSVISAHIQR